MKAIMLMGYLCCATGMLYGAGSRVNEVIMQLHKEDLEEDDGALEGTEFSRNAGEQEETSRKCTHQELFQEKGDPFLEECCSSEQIEDAEQDAQELDPKYNIWAVQRRLARERIELLRVEQEAERAQEQARAQEIEREKEAQRKRNASKPPICTIPI